MPKATQAHKRRIAIILICTMAVSETAEHNIFEIDLQKLKQASRTQPQDPGVMQISHRLLPPKRSSSEVCKLSRSGPLTAQEAGWILCDDAMVRQAVDDSDHTRCYPRRLAPGQRLSATDYVNVLRNTVSKMHSLCSLLDVC